MKHITCSSGSSIITYVEDLLDEILPQLSRKHLLIFSRNGFLPSYDEDCGIMNSYLASSPELIHLVLGLRISIHDVPISLREPSGLSAYDLLRLDENSAKNAGLHDLEFKQISKLTLGECFITSLVELSELAENFSVFLGYKSESPDRDLERTTVMENFHITTYAHNRHNMEDLYPNHQLGLRNVASMLTYANGENKYKIALLDQL